MIIYTNDLKQAIKSPEVHDRNSKIFYGFIYRPQTWSQSTTYSIGSLVLPTTFNGWCFEAIAPGISGAQEPVFIVTGSTLLTTEQQGLVWKAKPYLSLPVQQNILSSEWTAHDPDTLLEIPQIVLDSSSFTSDTTAVRVSGVPSTVETFLLRNKTIRGNSTLDPETSKETIYRSLVITVGDT